MKAVVLAAALYASAAAGGSAEPPYAVEDSSLAAGRVQDPVSEPAAAEAPAAEPPTPLRELARGLASWYGPRFHGRRTASGERFDMHALTAAHPTLPFGTVVRVESLVNGRSVEVRINDRGPHIKKRVIDLSRAAAEALGLLDTGRGTKPVVLKVVRAPE